MKQEKPFIKRFQIEELFGIYNVDIPFEDDINIFVGENGLGKTTILNCINYVLQCDSDNLYNINFKKIIVTFRDKAKVEIKHDELMTDNMFDLDYRRRHMIYISNEMEYENTSFVSMVKTIYRELKKKSNKKKIDVSEMSMAIMRRIRPNIGSRLQIEKIVTELENNSEKDWESIIQDKMNNNIIYLPTYRRIEEDFNKCMNNDIKYRNDIMKKISNLQFGMDDVELLIKKTCEELRNNTNEGFKEMTSNLLKNYVSMLKNPSTKDKKIKHNIEESKLRIVFERLADKIDEDVKKSIIELLNQNDKMSDFGYSYLVTIINNLLEIYEKTRNTDESLDKFTSVCNKYLENNTFIYNPFKIECNLIQEYGGEPIEFKNLSSGEKQIVSLFSKLYLSKDSNNIILFDEPELSLSIVWQSKLLPDIIESNKCKFMVVITHSPFIFDNDYKKYTKDIKNFITPIKDKIKFV